MPTTRCSLIACLALAITLGAQSLDAQAPTYADDATREVVERMLTVHGGMRAWRDARTIAFDHVLFMPQVPPSIENGSPWMISQEVVEQTSGRAYADYPLWGSSIASDGRETWSVDWTFPNPAQQMLRIHYQLTFLPWLSQRGDATLELTGEGPIREGDETVYRAVSLRYAGGGPAWTLYLDPDTHVMRAFEVAFGPEAVALHVIRDYADLDGLVVPSDWTTYFKPDGRLIGYHAILNLRRNVGFDEARMEVPEDADVVGR